MQEQNQEFEQELNLREYIEIIIKRKKLILAIFCVSVIATVAISLITPKNYEVSMLIEPPIAGISASGAPIFLDSPLNMKAIIDGGAFDSKVVKALELDPRKTAVKLKVSQPKDSSVLKVALNEPKIKVELRITILNRFFEEMSSYYKDIIESKKNDVDRMVSVVSNGIKGMNDSIKMNEASLKIVESQENELMSVLKDTKTNTEQLLIERKALLEKKAPVDDISSLLYTNTIQQNITYFNQINNQLAEIKTKKERVANDAKILRNKINNSALEIERLKAAQKTIRNMGLPKEPQVSLQPIGAGRMQAVVLAGVLSLILGAFLAFFIEYWQKTKKAG